MSYPIRGESWKLSYGPQYYDDGTLHADVELASRVVCSEWVDNMFGIFSAANLPDPVFEAEGRWAYGTDSNRNWYKQYFGKTTLSGGISDILLLNAAPLYLPIGQLKTTGKTTAAFTPAVTLNGAHTRGSKTITINSGTGVSNDDYIQIGSGDTAEVRVVSSGGGTTTLTMDRPINNNHATAESCVKVTNSGGYNHYTIESQVLDPFTIDTQFVNTNGQTSLIRRYIGCKVNRATMSCAEGEMLTLSLDEILSRSIAYYELDGAGTGFDEDFYSADVNTEKPTVSCVNTNPYYFSQGSLTIDAVEICRIKEFKLSVNNNIEPLYYVCSGSNSKASGKVPYELREGKREYELSITVDVEDHDMWTYLMKKGQTASGTYKGFQCELIFTRGSGDTVTFTIPSNTPDDDGDSQGCFLKSSPYNISENSLVNSPLDIITRGLQITSEDDLNYYG